MRLQRKRNAVQCQSRIAAEGFHRFAIKISYDGTDYQGFQSQVHGKTIQDQIELRLGSMLRRKVRIYGWGRTDSGVHARGAVITVDLTSAEVDKFARARKGAKEDSSDRLQLTAKCLHSTIKHFECSGGLCSITALSAVPVARDFDPRFSSLWKRYVYYISCGNSSRSPFLNRYAWQMDSELDFKKMEAAAQILTGEHNFEWLSEVQAGELRDSVRSLELRIERMDPGIFFHPECQGATMIKISGTCDFFLYKMMRRVVGILVRIGLGRAKLAWLEECVNYFDVLMSDPNVEPMTIPGELLETAPSKGLCLEHIEYAISI